MQPEPTGDPTPTRGVRVALATLALGAFALALTIGRWLFPRLSANNDEAVYRFQAAILRSGHLTLPAAPYQGAFRPWMSGVHDDRLVLVFQPVFPALLALSDLLFTSPRVALGLVAAACPLLMFRLSRELGLTPGVALLAAALFALSPLALVQSALFLEYLFAVALELAALTLAVRGCNTGRPRLFPASGLLFGLLLFTRPLEALMLGAATLLYLWRRDAAASARRVGLIVIGVLPLFASMLAYNAYLTGSALRFPLWAIGGNNSFGFGQRYIVKGAPIIDATFVNSLKALHQNLRSLPHWAAGGVLTVPVAGYGLWMRRRDAATVLLVAIAAIFPFGYVFYWGNLFIVNGRKQIGPHYYVALLIPLAFFTATGLHALWSRVAARRGVPTARLAALAVAVAMAGATAVELPDKIDRNRHFSDAYAAEQALLDAVVAEPAIVVVPITPDGAFVLHPRGWLVNDLGLRNATLYAADRGADNFDVATSFPTRRIFRLQAVEATRSPLTFRPSVREVRVTAAESRLDRRVVATPPAGTERFRVYLQIGSQRRECAVTRLGTTPIDLALTLAPPRAGLSGCLETAEAPLAAPRTVVTVGVEYYRTGSDAPFEIVEARLPVETRATAPTVAVFDTETWRIVPADKTPARVIERDTDLAVTAA